MEEIKRIFHNLDSNCLANYESYITNSHPISEHSVIVDLVYRQGKKACAYLHLDLSVGDYVVIRSNVTGFELAKVSAIYSKFIHSNSEIVCKISELVKNKSGKYEIPKSLPATTVIHTIEELIYSLKNKGWVASRENDIQILLTFTNATNTSYLRISKNTISIKGFIEMQLLPKNENFFKYAYSSRPLGLEGKFKTYFIDDVKYNLFETMLRYAVSFQKNERELTPYFEISHIEDYHSETPAVNSRIVENNNGGGGGGTRDNLFDQLADEDDESVYLTDGVWLNSDGTTSDRGR